jgi:hypothetical protein
VEITSSDSLKRETPRASSCDAGNPEDPWAPIYRQAAQRRRARGWHRWREPARTRSSKRLKFGLTAAAFFLACTLVALLLPR